MFFLRSVFLLLLSLSHNLFAGERYCPPALGTAEGILAAIESAAAEGGASKATPPPSRACMVTPPPSRRGLSSAEGATAVSVVGEDSPGTKAVSLLEEYDVNCSRDSGSKKAFVYALRGLRSRSPEDLSELQKKYAKELTEPVTLAAREVVTFQKEQVAQFVVSNKEVLFDMPDMARIRSCYFIFFLSEEPEFFLLDPRFHAARELRRNSTLEFTVESMVRDAAKILELGAWKLATEHSELASEYDELRNPPDTSGLSPGSQAFVLQNFVKGAKRFRDNEEFVVGIRRNLSNHFDQEKKDVELSGRIKRKLESDRAGVSLSSDDLDFEGIFASQFPEMMVPEDFSFRADLDLAQEKHQPRDFPIGDRKCKKGSTFSKELVPDGEWHRRNTLPIMIAWMLGYEFSEQPVIDFNSMKIGEQVAPNQLKSFPFHLRLNGQYNIHFCGAVWKVGDGEFCALVHCYPSREKK